ncbi:hypothetical protein [Streptomyces canus]|uniref:hypothetical protein n=1 Tax=Streptomyces canus TaxID=58343 RepID=UPI00324D9F65
MQQIEDDLNADDVDGTEPTCLPVPFPKAPPKEPRFAALRAWWNKAWDVDGVLYDMWEDVLSAPEDGLRDMAPWLRAVLAVAGVSFVVLTANAAGEVILQALHQQLLTAVPRVQVGVDTSSGVFAVVDQPVRTYIAQNSAGLPVDGSTVYTLWLLTGIVGLGLGYLSRNNGVRAMWSAHGAATVWMVWTATPDASRPVAAGLAWTFLSAFAMRGLTLRRPVGRRHARRRPPSGPRSTSTCPPRPRPPTRTRTTAAPSGTDLRPVGLVLAHPPGWARTRPTGRLAPRPPTNTVGGRGACCPPTSGGTTRAHPPPAPPDRPSSPAAARPPLPAPSRPAARRLEAVMPRTRKQRRRETQRVPRSEALLPTGVHAGSLRRTAVASVQARR